MGRAAPLPLQRRLHLGPRILRHDLPELPELDNLFAPEGPILRAQELAADAFGAGRTHFLCNGSTAGVLAAVLACVQLWRQRNPTATTPAVVVLPRNVHKSAVHALVVAGAEPCWLIPELDADTGLCLGVATSSVCAALERCAGRVAAVVLVSPTYHGVLSDVAACAAACTAVRAPLVVDEAHGAHLSFLPETAPLPAAWVDRRPRGALREGADVAIQSTHKVLGSLTQSGMLHVSERALASTPALGPALSAALAMVQSTSPNYLLLASLDAARWDLASPRGQGVQRLHRAARHAAALRAGLAAFPHGPWLVDPLALPSMQQCSPRRLVFPTGPWLVEPAPGPGAHAIDPLRLTLLAPAEATEGGEDGGGVGKGDANGEALGGFALDEKLIARGVYAELPGAHTLTFALSAGSERADVRRLLRALGPRERRGARQGEAPLRPSTRAATMAQLAATYHAAGWAGDGLVNGGYAQHGATRGLTPREAHFCARRTVPAAAAVGCLSAEAIAPYPPGIPVLLPGELITADTLAHLRAMRAAGCSITGCADPELQTLEVLDTAP